MTATAPRFRTAIRLAALTLLGVTLTALSAAPTHAMRHLRHLRLLRAAPAADTVLTASPDAIRLWFSEPVNAAVSKVTLAAMGGASGGANVTLAPLTRDAAKDAPLVAKLTAPLPVGSYTVTWKAMSKDGHVVNGTFGFQLRAAD